jgi:hypothetical protein
MNNILTFKSKEKGNNGREILRSVKTVSCLTRKMEDACIVLQIGADGLIAVFEI